MSFKKILIANRGEIAIRAIRACREMGIGSVAIYAEDDRKSLFYRIADESHPLVGSDVPSTYLNMEQILDVARKTGCEAIHPGYGFLSENPRFASACEDARIKFIGPRSVTMKKVGDKAEIKKIMKNAGIPILPSIEGGKDLATIKKRSNKIGYPLIIKPSFGGGGKGMRIVRSESELDEAVRFTMNIGKAAFGNAAFYIEKYLECPRHIEVQLLADTAGNIIDLGERDCSIQRRHQKLIEETPSPALTAESRREVIALAKKAARAVAYQNAGTVEFLFDGKNFYFLEINARIQVEHTITELVTGVDIVKQQIKIAAGEELHIATKRTKPNGCAIECRINAEDPENNFFPSPGKIKGYRSPGGIGVRVDSGVFMGFTIPPHYDSLVTKLSVWGCDRDEAAARMKRALDEYVIMGIKTTLPLYRAIFRENEFLKGKYDTSYIESHHDELARIMARVRAAGKAHDKLLMSVFKRNVKTMPVRDATCTFEDYLGQ